jgi:uncharacterized membrane protein YjjP (DUF1212 family)
VVSKVDTTQLDDTSEFAWRSAAHRALTVILRIGALLLGSGASTNDVETTMYTLAEAGTLQPTGPYQATTGSPR